MMDEAGGEFFATSQYHHQRTVFGAGYQFNFTVLHTNFMFIYIDQPGLVVARSTDKYMVLAVLVNVLRFLRVRSIGSPHFFAIYDIQGSNLALEWVHKQMLTDQALKSALRSCLSLL